MIPEDQEPVEDQTIDADESAGSAPPRPRRRARAVLRGARIRPRRSKLLMLFTLIFALAASVAATWFVAVYFRSNPRYRLATIELRGEKYLGKSEVEAVFRTDAGRSIYNIPLEERRRQIEEISWVHHASVTRVLPSEIWVRVEERQPVAFLWSPRGASLIDGEGVVLDTPPETYFNLPVVRGVTLREREDSRRDKLRRLVSFLDAVKSVGPTAIEQVSEVNLADPRNLRAIVSQGEHSVLLHFGDELFAERFQTYLTHISDWRRQFAEMQSIDLRYEGQAVIHSAGSEAVRVDSPNARPAQSPAAALTLGSASRADAQTSAPVTLSSTNSERAHTADATAEASPDDELPNPPLQQAGMGPNLSR